MKNFKKIKAKEETEENFPEKAEEIYKMLYGEESEENTKKEEKEKSKKVKRPKKNKKRWKDH